MQVIPLANGAANAHQRFSVQIEGQILRFEVNYLSYLDSPAWSVDLYRDGTPLALGAMLEPGCDILQSYEAGVGQLVFVGEPVTLDNLGVNNSLVWVPAP